MPQPPESTVAPPLYEHQTAASKALSALVTHSTTTDGRHTQPHTVTKPSTTILSFHVRDLISYNNIEAFENNWHLGNYVIDRATGTKSFEPMSFYVRLGMHLLYYGYPQSAVLHFKRMQDLLKAQSENLGAWYDSPQSASHVAPFISDFNLQSTLQDLLEPDPMKYPTFNAFFARQIKPSARPIAAPEDPLVISSPADCRLTVFPTTDLATKYWIKGHAFTLSKLLNSETLATHFAGGAIAISRLAPQDYHRWHSPTDDGVVESITEIPGTYYTVNPQAVTQPGTLNVFCENKRSVMIVRRRIESPASGETTTTTTMQRNESNSDPLVAIIAVGAMLVGSLKYAPSITVGSSIKRGQCLGAFYYGGSTVIVLFPPGGKGAAMDQDLVKNSVTEQCETFVRVGWRVGRFGS